MVIQAFQLPLAAAATLVVIGEHDGIKAVAPALTPDLVDDICARLLAARQVLTGMTTERIVRGIAAAADRLRTDESLPAALAAFTGYSEPMAAHVLRRMLEDWSESELQKLIASEFGGSDVLETSGRRTDDGLLRAVAPPLGLHVFSGNVPGVAVTSIIRALLVRSAVFGKSAAAEPVLAPAFARALEQVDAELGACVAVTWWRGGDDELEQAVLRHARMVVHYGGAEAIASLRARAPEGTLFIEHGPRISFALIDGAAASSAARDLARAVALFDQQGCVSPQCAWVIGSRDQARELAAAVAAALDVLEDELPRGRVSAAEAAAVRELRASAEFRGIAGADVELWEGTGLSYTVIRSDDVAFEGSCLNRTLIVRHAPRLEDVLEALRPFRPWLQTVGLAGFDEATSHEHARRLADAGATRITRVADMPWPPMTWHHDGRGPLRELVRFVDIERAP